LAAATAAVETDRETAVVAPPPVGRDANHRWHRRTPVTTPIATPSVDHRWRRREQRRTPRTTPAGSVWR